MLNFFLLLAGLIRRHLNHAHDTSVCGPEVELKLTITSNLSASQHNRLQGRLYVLM